MTKSLRSLSRLLLISSLLTCSVMFGGGLCKTTPVQVSIASGAISGGPLAMIYPDSGGPYVDGAAGVIAYINTACTGDLIFDLEGSTRRAGFSFQSVLAANANTPQWVQTQPAFTAAASRFVVANLMYLYAEWTDYTFTTTAQFAFTAPDSQSTLYAKQDKLCFANPAAQVYRSCGTNSPYTTSLIVIHHAPATSSTPETWTITVDPTNMGGSGATQAATLLVPVHNLDTNAGQFSVPLQFTVTRK